MFVRQINRQVRIIKDNAAPYKLQSNIRTAVNYIDNPSRSTRSRHNGPQQEGYGGSGYARTSVPNPHGYKSPPQNEKRSRYEQRHFHDNAASFVSAECCFDRTQHSFGPPSSQQCSQNSPIVQRGYYTNTGKRGTCWVQPAATSA